MICRDGPSPDYAIRCRVPCYDIRFQVGASGLVRSIGLRTIQAASLAIPEVISRGTDLALPRNLGERITFNRARYSFPSLLLVHVHLTTTTEYLCAVSSFRKKSCVILLDLLNPRNRLQTIGGSRKGSCKSVLSDPPQGTCELHRSPQWMPSGCLKHRRQIMRLQRQDGFQCRQA